MNLRQKYLDVIKRLPIYVNMQQGATPYLKSLAYLLAHVKEKTGACKARFSGSDRLTRWRTFLFSRPARHRQKNFKFD